MDFLIQIVKIFGSIGIILISKLSLDKLGAFDIPVLGTILEWVLAIGMFIMVYAISRD